MRRLVWTCALAILAATAGGPVETLAQAPERGLSDAETRLAAQLESPAFQRLRAASPFADKAIPRLADSAAGRAQRSVVTHITLLGSPGTSSQMDRQALVTRYEYGSGLTFMTVVDLNAGRVIDVRAEANRPTPLAADEIRRAIALAGLAVPDLATTPASRLQVLSLIDSAPASPRYGHRLVLVWRDDPIATRRVLVDLTAEHVVDPSF